MIYQGNPCLIIFRYRRKTNAKNNTGSGQAVQTGEYPEYGLCGSGSSNGSNSSTFDSSNY